MAAAVLSPIITFGKDLFSDLKSSRRFQVATVLWIPLFITAFILFIRFSIVNYYEEKYHEWKNTLVPMSTLNFPKVLIHFPRGNNRPTGPITCNQPWSTNPTKSVNSITEYCTWDTTDSGCYLVDLSGFQSSGNDIYSYAVNCTMTFPPDQTGQNSIIDLHFPGGFATWPGNWHKDGVPVRPNQLAAVHIEPEHFYPMGGSPIDAWHVKILYETTIFTTSTNGSYVANLLVRIPYTMINAHWEAVGVDSWVLMALWGGGFFFFYFLHCVAFGIAKIWLPNDSKLLRGGAAAAEAEYTQIK